MTDKIHYELVEWTDKFLELAIWKMFIGGVSWMQWKF